MEDSMSDGEWDEHGLLLYWQRSHELGFLRHLHGYGITIVECPRNFTVKVAEKIKMLGSLPYNL